MLTSVSRMSAGWPARPGLRLAHEMLIFGHMKLCLACVFCGLSLALTAFAADSTVASNAPPGLASGTNDTKEPAVPGDLFTNTVGMELVKVGGFWAGKFPVTQQEYQKVTGFNPSAFPGETHPVDSVSWNDAMDFCAKLTAVSLLSNDVPAGYYYTLPTESEWQSLVADASLKDAVSSQTANRSGSASVGSLGPNSLGLFDMRGNVMEFCLADPGKPYRVLHGGSWKDRLDINLRPEFRFYCQPDDKQNTFGLRVLLKKP